MLQVQLNSTVNAQEWVTEEVQVAASRTLTNLRTRLLTLGEAIRTLWQAPIHLLCPDVQEQLVLLDVAASQCRRAHRDLAEFFEAVSVTDLPRQLAAHEILCAFAHLVQRAEGFWAAAERDCNATMRKVRDPAAGLRSPHCH